MKNIVRRTFQRVVQYLGPRVGLVVCNLSEPNNSAGNVAFLSEEIETPPEWLTVTLH